MGSGVAWFSAWVRRAAGSARVSRLSVLMAMLSWVPALLIWGQRLLGGDVAALRGSQWVGSHWGLRVAASLSFSSGVMFSEIFLFKFGA